MPGREGGTGHALLKQFRSFSTHPAWAVLMSCLSVCYCSLVIPVHGQSSLQPVPSTPVSLQVHAGGSHLSFTCTGV